ncbi:hypothetical protein MRS44_000779 [Fusarium solani]|jgi:hypothetical protein|uniref:uncharacterized protein n=1 Tax=Fusarium solani TaxID=169388 RepID=UPI0032C48BA2|nr:hypothetical protein MRS44_000779 [Fusarium solani]
MQETAPLLLALSQGLTRLLRDWVQSAGLGVSQSLRFHPIASDPAISSCSHVRSVPPTQDTYIHTSNQVLLPSVRQASGHAHPRLHIELSFPERGEKLISSSPFPSTPVDIHRGPKPPLVPSLALRLTRPLSARPRIFITAGPGALPASTPERTHHWPS